MDITLNELQSKVNQIVGTTTITNDKVDSTSLMAKYNINKNNLYYIAVPIVIMILLYVSKPSFIMIEVSDEDGSSTKKLSMKKMFISIVMFSAIILLSYGLYTYKKKTDKV